MKTKQLILRWPFLTGGLIAAFWGIWYLVNGSVPVVTSIEFPEMGIYVLPFGISRWWDVLVGPILLSILMLIMMNNKINSNNLVAGLATCLAGGLGIGLSVGFAFSLIIGLGIGLSVGFAFSLIIGLGIGLSTGLAALMKIISKKIFWERISNGY